MAKEIKSIVKLQIPAGKATPAPPVGQALAPHGINLSDFCQQFNDATKEQSGWTIPVEITIFEDRTFKFITKQPPASELLKKAAGIEKASGEPQKVKVGKITKDQLKEITKRKMPDLNTKDIESAMKILAGTAKSMGIEIE
ncbi:MAG: 50S ribosomal protein L11 [Candidatus Pacebacteria bacterium]|nr:50S ribosomal protein L11 [Candidatus Paceibacterota bacterium]